jgi:hypothetical protein
MKLSNNICNVFFTTIFNYFDMKAERSECKSKLIHSFKSPVTSPKPEMFVYQSNLFTFHTESSIKNKCLWRKNAAEKWNFRLGLYWTIKFHYGAERRKVTLTKKAIWNSAAESKWTARINYGSNWIQFLCYAMRSQGFTRLFFKWSDEVWTEESFFWCDSSVAISRDCGNLCGWVDVGCLVISLNKKIGSDDGGLACS